MKAIVVDSRLAREGLVRMLSEFKEINNIVAAEDVSTALRLIEQHQLIVFRTRASLLFILNGNISPSVPNYL